MSSLIIIHPEQSLTTDTVSTNRKRNTCEHDTQQIHQTYSLSNSISFRSSKSRRNSLMSSAIRFGLFETRSSKMPVRERRA